MTQLRHPRSPPIDRLANIGRQGQTKRDKALIGLLPEVFHELSHLSQGACARELNRRGIASVYGRRWHARTVAEFRQKVDGLR